MKISEDIIFEIAPGFLDHYALLLWREGKDFSAFPGTIFFPVPVDRRRGYLLDRQIAQDYKPPDQPPEA